MTATGSKRPAPAFFARLMLAGMAAALTVGQARAQFVNPVPPTTPTFNTPPPSAVTPPPPVTPVSPTAPGGVSGSGIAPAPQGVVPPISTARQKTSEPTSDAADQPRRHARIHTVARDHGSRRHGRVYAARVRGPSYYPGLGEFYPPYVNPCHFRPTYYVYYGTYPSYRCTW